jgi:hypothetical protein
VARLDDRRAYGPGLAGGVLAGIWSYWHRDEDLPNLLLAAVMLMPYYGLIGFWWARRTRTTGTAALMGGVTAVLGFEVVILLTATQATITDTAGKSLLWLFAGLLFATPVFLLGAFCGLVGGALAHPASTI